MIDYAIIVNVILISSNLSYNGNDMFRITCEQVQKIEVNLWTHRSDSHIAYLCFPGGQDSDLHMAWAYNHMNKNQTQPDT